MKVGKRTVCCMTVAVIFSVLLGRTLSVNAGNFFRDSTTKKQLFAVPEGGWSSINVEVQYVEKYSTSGNNNTFNERQKWVSYLRTYATSCPVVSLGNVKHSNDTYFTSWIQDTVIFDPNKWEGCACWSNYDSVTYSNTATITGTLPYILSCDGAIPALVPCSLELSLKE